MSHVRAPKAQAVQRVAPLLEDVERAMVWSWERGMVRQQGLPIPQPRSPRRTAQILWLLRRHVAVPKRGAPG